MSAKAYRRAFPKLTDSNHQETSQFDPTYNCIGHAAESRLWWQPEPTFGLKVYWPSTAPREMTVDAYIKAYEAEGYTTCSDELHEDGFKKIAIYALNGIPKHAARQLTQDSWTSKLGRGEDITHQLHDITGPMYGCVVAFLKKPV